MQDQDPISLKLMLFYLFVAVHYIIDIFKRIYIFIHKYQIPIFILVFIILFFTKKVDIKKLKLSDAVVAVPLIVLLI